MSSSLNYFSRLEANTSPHCHISAAAAVVLSSSIHMSLVVVVVVVVAVVVVVVVIAAAVVAVSPVCLIAFIRDDNKIIN